MSALPDTEARVAQIIRDNLSGPMFDEPHLRALHDQDIENTASLIVEAIAAQRIADAARIAELESPAGAARVLLNMQDAPFMAARDTAGLTDKKAVGFLNAIAEAAPVAGDCVSSEVLAEREREQGDGTTPVHEMLDAAILEAVEQGAEGVKLGDEK